MKKRILSLILAMLMLVSLVACGNNQDEPGNDAPTANDAPQNNDATSGDEGWTGEVDHIIVTYMTLGQGQLVDSEVVYLRKN